jgi:TonB family protein
MTSFVKDPENAAAPAAPGTPAAPAAGSPARPQPVALEVPVTVNGARSVDGSDKREPFSERSQTVLVFGHGAVLRISAQLAPGQLVFLTNEKTKKEVVCVVVKSKTDGNAVGYVELRFTEPAPGFWGMRFPADTVLPQAANRPTAPSAVPAPPKVMPVAPPLAAKSVTSPTPVAVTPVIAAPPAPVSLRPDIPKATPPPAPVAPAVSLQSVPAAEVTSPSVASSPLFAPPEKKSLLPAAATNTSVSTPQSTDDLKQQAARLQEQLSSLLFADAPKTASSTPEPVFENTTSTELAQNPLDLTNSTPASAPAQPVKTVASSPKPGSSSLEVEEIKIPAWLAPLARESETPAAAQNSSAETTQFTELEAVAAESTHESITPEAHEVSPRPEIAVFGGQLLGESSSSADAAASGSKTGLFLGMAASLLLVAGGVWYSRQPGNPISGLLGGSSTTSQQAAPSAVDPAPFVAKPAARSESPVAASSAPEPAPAVVNPPSPLASAVKNAPAAPVSRNANPIVMPGANVVPRSTPPVEESKKPALGDVRMAKPVIKRGKASSAAGESELSLDVSSNANNSTPLSGLTASHRNGPAAPTPVGGDVKPAKLIKSVQPIYPQMARTQHVSGDVQVDALIDADGNVSSMKVLSGPALLRDAALQSLKQWKYQPAELDGKPTSMHLTVVLQFRAQ